MEEELQNHSKKEETYEEKIREMRSRIIVLQHERDQDINNSAAMLRYSLIFYKFNFFDNIVCLTDFYLMKNKSFYFL